jgi:hypothetical protein
VGLSWVMIGASCSGCVVWGPEGSGSGALGVPGPFVRSMAWMSGVDESLGGECRGGFFARQCRVSGDDGMREAPVRGGGHQGYFGDRKAKDAVEEIRDPSVVSAVQMRGALRISLRIHQHEFRKIPGLHGPDRDCRRTAVLRPGQCSQRDQRIHDSPGLTCSSMTPPEISVHPPGRARKRKGLEALLDFTWNFPEWWFLGFRPRRLPGFVDFASVHQFGH